VPHLHIFSTCEKVIIDQAGSPSLIALFNIVVASGEKGVAIPSNAVVPKEWCIFTAWDSESTDVGKEYSQFVEILWPDKSVFTEKREFKFVFQATKRQQVRIQLQAFPVGQQGKYTIRMWLEHKGSVVVEPRSIQLEVQHAQVPEPS